MLKALASITCSEPGKVLDVLLDAISAHMQTVDRVSSCEAVTGYNREMKFLLMQDGIKVEISTVDPSVMNQLKYSVSSLLNFHFKGEVEPVTWEGDAPEETLPQGLQCLEVKRTEQISPGLRRIWFGGDDISNYDTLDNIHARLLFKKGRGAPAEWPKMTPQGEIRWPEGTARLDTRIFTIRHVDTEKNELAVDFFLGDHSGPVVEWARGAETGDQVGFIGPAAHGIIRADFTIYIGDETGFPGVARCLEALEPAAKGVAFLLIKDIRDRIGIRSPKGFKLIWIEDDGAYGLARALDKLELPVDPSECALWCGAEYSDFKVARQFAKKRGIPKEKTVTFAHWRAGMNEPEIAAAGSQSVT